MTNPRAGLPAQPADLVDVAKLITAYYCEHPDPAVVEQRVTFGTSGHRGSAFSRTFNEDHIVATSQAICDYRAGAGITGPLLLTRSTARPPTAEVSIEAQPPGTLCRTAFPTRFATRLSASRGSPSAGAGPILASILTSADTPAITSAAWSTSAAARK